MTRSTVVIELVGDAGVSRDLAAGGVFVPGCALRLAEECDLVVRGANQDLVVPARVVYVDDQRGAGLELIGFSSELKAQLAELEPIAPSRLEFLDDPAIDGSALDDLPPPDDDFGLGGLSEPFPLVDLQALDDADDDDLAVPVAGGPGAGHDDDDDDDDLALPVAGGPGAYTGDGAHAIHQASADGAFAGDPGGDDAGDAAAYDDAIDSTGDKPAHRRAAIYDAVMLGNFADLDPANPDYAYLTNAKTLPPESAAIYLAREDSRGGELEDDLATQRPDERDDQRDGEPENQPEHQPEHHPGDPLDPREPGAATRRVGTAVHERLRGLTLAAQLKLAVSGEQHERIVLERLYGKNVWEPLLRNPRLTAPEVARIARYGALPRVLLEIILGNGAWLQISEVRRALLSNPRLGTDQVMKVLRLTPKHELKLAAIQTAYPPAVRQAARLLLRND